MIRHYAGSRLGHVVTIHFHPLIKEVTDCLSLRSIVRPVAGFRRVEATAGALDALEPVLCHASWRG